eukprot:gnl/Dysnectes_brevis/6947_a11218_289.p1 GENE.gnl/Dysnectes_brevis/6947_a11218_289~~gnl/Dysnectes_brevis/6947_a11218_289.p1  ORF type:complete len:372 (+),score=95.03 gnl/Dysnectes_brevis/6947_a11218_289:101-1216(+)
MPVRRNPKIKVKVSSQPSKVTTRQLPVFFQAIVDTSGSMAGGKISAVADELKSLLTTDSKLKKHDKIEVRQFACSLKTVFPFQDKLRVDTDRLIAELPRHVARSTVGTMTALYDCLAMAIQELKKYRLGRFRKSAYGKSPICLLFLTDGGDNASVKFNADTIGALVAKSGIPNFNLYIVGVGLRSRVSETLSQICAPQHAHYVPCGSDYDVVRKTLRKVTRDMITSVTITLRGDLGRGAGAGDMLRTVQAAMNSSSPARVPRLPPRSKPKPGTGVGVVPGTDLWRYARAVAELAVPILENDDSSHHGHYLVGAYMGNHLKRRGIPRYPDGGCIGLFKRMAQMGFGKVCKHPTTHALVLKLTQPASWYRKQM